MYTYIFVYVCICMCVYTYVCVYVVSQKKNRIYIYICIYICIYMHKYIYIHTYIYMHMCVCVCVCVCVCIYTSIYICLYMALGVQNKKNLLFGPLSSLSLAVSAVDARCLPFPAFPPPLLRALASRSMPCVNARVWRKKKGGGLRDPATAVGRPFSALYPNCHRLFDFSPPQFILAKGLLTLYIYIHTCMYT
jgi:hypothetical protein